MLRVRTQPTRREVLIFGALWLAFWAGIAALAAWRPALLLVPAVVLGAGCLISLVFNADDPKGAQLAGLVPPLVLGGAAGAQRAGVPPGALLGLGVAIGLAGLAATALTPELGRRLYVGWMRAFAPAGWSIARITLGTVYYVVLTPIGLLLRLAGYDPMSRRFDRNAASYWVERRERDDRSYLRQF